MDESQTIRIGYVHSAPLLNTTTTEPISAVDIEREVEALRTVFKLSGQKIRFRQEVATVPKFQKMLAKGCALLHFTGHGLASGELAFETEQGDLHPLRSNNLRELLLAEDGETIRTKVAFISACHSQEAGVAFEMAGVPHVVAIKLDSEVLDKVAIQFSTVFYSTLLAGSTVKHSFEMADRTVRATRNTSHFAESEFLLLPKDSPIHETALFHKIEPALNMRSFFDETAPTPTNACNYPPRPFIGRHVEMQKAFKLFVDGCRCVSITGMSGIGKSALACRLAHHLAQRHMFCSVLCFDLSEESETLSEVMNKFRPRRLSDQELIRRGLALILEKSLDRGQNGNKNEPLWSQENEPLPTELLDLVQRIVRTCSPDLLEPIHRGSSNDLSTTVVVGVEPASPKTELNSIEHEAAAVHERWRVDRRNDLLAQGLGGNRQPCWRRLDPNELTGWLSQLPEGANKIHYLYAPPLSVNASVPDESPPDDQSWLEVPIQRSPSVHWVDIDIEYALLPESWKDKNRAQVPYRTRASSAVESPWSPHNPPPVPPLNNGIGDEGAMSAPLRPLLIVLDGADSKRSAVVDILNKLFHRYQLVCVLSTCVHGLTGTVPEFSARIALESEPEKQIRIDALRAAEAAELLVHSSPRNLTLAEMGLKDASSWTSSMHYLSQRPAVQALKGHPRAIRQFAPDLGKQKVASSSGSSTYLPLDDLVDLATYCYDTAKQSKFIQADSPVSPETLVTFEKLNGDMKSLSIWKELTKSMKGPSHIQKVTWHGHGGLAVALEKDLNEACMDDDVLLSSSAVNLPERYFTQSDISFLQTIMFPPKTGEVKEEFVFDNFVKFSKWWRSIRVVVKWLNRSYRGCRMGGEAGGGGGGGGGGGAHTMIHGFFDRKNANELLKDKPLGCFLLRFSESKPDQLVIVFNEQLGHSATHCLVQLIDRTRCCITFEGGARQEYNSLGDLVLDCRRLSCLPSGISKSSLFRSSNPQRNTSALPEPLDLSPLRPSSSRIDPLEQ